MENGAVLVNGQPVPIFYFINNAYTLQDSINLTPCLKFGEKTALNCGGYSRTSILE